MRYSPNGLRAFARLVAVDLKGVRTHAAYNDPRHAPRVVAHIAHRLARRAVPVRGANAQRILILYCQARRGLQRVVALRTQLSRSFQFVEKRAPAQAQYVVPQATGILPIGNRIDDRPVERRGATDKQGRDADGAGLLDCRVLPL